MVPGPNAIMRVIFATTLDLSVGAGPTDHVAGIVRHLSSLDFRVTLLCPKPAGAIDPQLIGNACLVHYPSARVLGLPTAFGGVLALPALVRLREADVLYVRASSGTLPLTAFGRQLGFKRIVVEHNGWLRDEVETFGYPRIFARLAALCQVREARLASVNRTVTRELSETLVRHRVHPSRVEVIENGTDTIRFRPLDKAECRHALHLAADGKPVAAFLGNLSPGAGVETLLRAMSILEGRGTSIRLLVAGDGIQRRSLELEAERYRANGVDIEFVGWLGSEQANLLLGAADIAVAPYLQASNAAAGNSGLKIRAYAAAGKPVVVSRLRGTDQLHEQPWVFFAEPGSPDSLADAIESALRADACKMTHTARAFAEGNDWSIVAGRIARLLKAA